MQLFEVKIIRVIIGFCVISATTLLTGCRFIKPLDGPGMVREVNDSLLSETPDSVVAEMEGEPSGEDEAGGLAPYRQVKIDIDSLPKSAERVDSYFQYAVYVNKETEGNEDAGEEGVYTVWLANERWGSAIMACRTNPTAPAQWEQMKGDNPDAVDVPLHLIATASEAWLAPGDVSKVIVQGCPDGRNVWTYIIDTFNHTAKQLPSSEGVIDRDWEKKEITVASYGYDDDGRYSFKRVYSLDGKFLRRVGEKERE